MDGFDFTQGGIPHPVEGIKAGVLATQANIQNQFVNLGGQLKPIRSLSTHELTGLRDRLYKASRRYEDRANLPVIAPLALHWLIIAIIGVVLNHYHAKIHPTDGWILFGLAGLPSVPIWIALRDVRRRNRMALHAAERWWAEVAVELDSRADAPQPTMRKPSLKPVLNFFGRLSSRRM